MANPTQQDYLRLRSDFDCLTTRFSEMQHDLHQVQTDFQQVSAERATLAQQVQQLSQENQLLQASLAQSRQSVPTSSSSSAASSSHTIREPKISLPSKFDGSRSQFRGFLNQIRLLIQLHPSRYPDSTSQVGLVGSLLSGTALSWFSPLLEKNSSLLHNFKDFVDEFKSCFSDTDNVRTATNKIRNIRQANRPASTYAAEYRMLACDIPWDEEALIDQFRHGLRSDVKDLLLTFHEEPKTLAEAISRAVRCDNRLFERRSERLRTRPEGTSYASVVSSPAYNQAPRYHSATAPAPTAQYQSPPLADGPVPMEIDAATRRGPRGPLSDAEKQRRRNNGLCLYCGEHGHIAANCPVAPRRRQANPVEYQQRPPVYQQRPAAGRFQMARRPQVNHIDIPARDDHIDIQVPSPRALSRNNSFEVLSHLNDESN